MKFSALRRNLFSALTLVALLGLAPPLVQTARAQSHPPTSSTANENEIRAATLLFYAALNSTSRRRPRAARRRIVPSTPTSPTYDAAGGYATGWNEVRAGFLNMSRLYPRGNITQRDMRVVAGTDMGYSVCIKTGQLLLI